jgi:GntR family transcriptional regulator / MocR family aminotransferase
MPKKRALLDWIKIERRAPTQLQHQVGDQIRAAIRSGRLPPGTPLPSSRTLAANLAGADIIHDGQLTTFKNSVYGARGGAGTVIQSDGF